MKESTMKTENESGARVKKARALLKMNQRDFARALGVSNSTVSQWESRGVPSKATVDIEKRFGIRADWLASGDGAAWTSDRATVDRSLARKEGARDVLFALVVGLSPELRAQLRDILNNAADAGTLND